MIKFIYFDIGGVVVKDFSGTNKWEEMLTDLGIRKADFQAINTLYDRYEREINTSRNVDTLIPIFEKEFNLVLPEDYSLLKDFASRFEKNEWILPAIQLAKSKYKIGLFTNMYPQLLETINNYNLLPLIEWDVIVDSSKENAQKPDPEIYHIAQKRAGAKSDEIFFVDNDKKNIQTAMNLGWKTFHYDPRNHEESSKRLLEIIESLK